MKLDTLIDGHWRKRRVQEHNSCTSYYRVISLSNFCDSKLVRSISLKVLKKLDIVIEGYEGSCRMQELLPCHQYLWSYFPS